ncbi:hypothetical protein LSAT2_019604 [Lamellibrachia satsuma]|nr:hypothetical protein LSAT2_019604 [Lamellibrachia satsuma]
MTLPFVAATQNERSPTITYLQNAKQEKHYGKAELVEGNSDADAKELRGQTTSRRGMGKGSLNISSTLQT